MIACPKCGRETTVAETRTIDHYVRRRRHCPSIACGARVTTAEIVIATDAERSRPLGDIVLVPKRDLEEMVSYMTQALATRMGKTAVVELVDRVLQGPTDNSPTGGQDEGQDGIEVER